MWVISSCFLMKVSFLPEVLNNWSRSNTLKIGRLAILLQLELTQNPIMKLLRSLIQLKNKKLLEASKISPKGYSPRYLFCIFFLDCWFKRKRYPSAAEKRIENKSSTKNIKYSSTFHNVFVVYQTYTNRNQCNLHYYWLGCRVSCNIFPYFVM